MPAWLYRMVPAVTREMARTITTRMTIFLVLIRSFFTSSRATRVYGVCPGGAADARFRGRVQDKIRGEWGVGSVRVSDQDLSCRRPISAVVRDRALAVDDIRAGRRSEERRVGKEGRS